MTMRESTLEALTEAARRASENAYCPYSHFAVGAAVLTEEGQTFTGCNVENSSYGLTICAERNAAFNAVAHSEPGTRIVAVAIYTPTMTPAPSCGACRQVISELGPDAEVVSVCDGPDILRQTVSELLPNDFSERSLLAGRERMANVR